MSQLIDLCGVPIQIKKIQNLQLIRRDYLFYPAYQEIQSESRTFWGHLLAPNKQEFQFTRMVPYGAILGEKEIPGTNNHEIKHFGEIDINTRENSPNPKKLWFFQRKKETPPSNSKQEKNVGGIAGFVADALQIDTSKDRVLRVVTYGHQLTTIRLRDVPAKVRFLSGKVSDVYQNDQIQKSLGEPIAPVITAVNTLVVTVDNTTHVFFGDGIDLEDAAEAYRLLYDAYKNSHSLKRVNTTLFSKLAVGTSKQVHAANAFHSQPAISSTPETPALPADSLDCK
ncbi:MAG: hypothetical protein IKK08_05470 [Clostridia bacterium]|nr:hypothetical protein [Clostridia bacterium]